MPTVGSFHETRTGTLRLVGGSEYQPRVPSPRVERDRRRRVAVTQENIAAAALDLEDARLIFAVRVSEHLDAGRAAVLTPENRRRLMKLSSGMGLEPFDASLVIAIVQDAARRGESAEDPMTTGRLRLVKPAARSGESVLLPLTAALILAAALVMVAASWITG